MKKIGIIIVGVIVLGGWAFFWWWNVRPLASVTIIDDGKEIVVKNAQQGTVGAVIAQAQISLSPTDHVTPSRDTAASAQQAIVIARHKNFRVIKGTQEETGEVFGRVSVKDGIAKTAVTYDADDIITVPLEDEITDGMQIEIIDVAHKEEKVQKAIPFKKIQKKDPEKKKGEKYVKQKGVPGQKEITYAITTHNGEEVSRRIVNEDIITEPIDDITLLGTYVPPPPVKFGKSHKGQASWYAHKGCNCAANPWLPFGTRVKVTNTSNGKSVIVKINDRGPFVAGRIIDLDKPAWKKIAPLGAGVIDVKMEEIKE